MLHYTWQVGDDETVVAARYFPQSGCSSVPDFLDVIHQQNYPTIYDFADIQPGTIVLIPLGTATSISN